MSFFITNPQVTTLIHNSLSLIITFQVTALSSYSLSHSSHRTPYVTTLSYSSSHNSLSLYSSSHNYLVTTLSCSSSHNFLIILKSQLSSHNALMLLKSQLSHHTPQVTTPSSILKLQTLHRPNLKVKWMDFLSDSIFYTTFKTRQCITLHFLPAWSFT